MAKSDRLTGGTWLSGLFRRDVSGRWPDDHVGGENVELPYPEATYWSTRSGQKIFDSGLAPVTNPTLLADAGLVITVGGIPLTI